MERVLIILFLALMCRVPVMAQTEGGLLLSGEVEKKINRQLSASVEADFRTRNDFKTVDRWSGSLGVGYKVTKWLKADAGYSLLYSNNREKIKEGSYWRPSYWSTRHRVNASVTADYKFFGSIHVSVRERWQYTYRPETTTDRYYFADYPSATWTGSMAGWNATEKVRDAKSKNQLRSRLQVEYDKKHNNIKPYASIELYNSFGIEKIRYNVGTDIKLSKQHSLDVYYRYQDQKNVDDADYEPDMHYIGVGYKFRF